MLLLFFFLPRPVFFLRVTLAMAFLAFFLTLPTFLATFFLARPIFLATFFLAAPIFLATFFLPRFAVFFFEATFDAVAFLRPAVFLVALRLPTFFFAFAIRSLLVCGAKTPNYMNHSARYFASNTIDMTEKKH